MTKLDLYETRLMEAIIKNNKTAAKSRPFTIYQYQKLLDTSDELFNEKVSKLLELELIKNYEDNETGTIKHYLYGKNINNLIKQKQSFYLR